MKTLKTTTMHVSNTTVRYTVMYDGTAYGLEIKALGDFEGYILVDDVARELNEAVEIAEFFAINSVFPDNVLEIFDDCLGM